MIYSRVAGVGGYLPHGAVTNDDLVARGVDTSDEWIVTRTGIRSRHLADDKQTTSDLAAEAAFRAMANAGVAAAEVDLIIVATSTPDYVFPSTACVLQQKIGNRRATAFDIQAVCSGFVYAMATADKFIRSGSHRCALVVGAEVFSRILDWKDRATCVLFGDGAGAVVMTADSHPGVLATALHADGSYSGILSVPGQVRAGQVVGDPFLRMDGQAVFKLAVRVLAEVANEVCAAVGRTTDSVRWLIPHQANLRILDATARKLGIPPDRVVVTVDRHANTSAASVPLALDAAVSDGRVRRGDSVLLEGVGGGFTWGAVLLDF